MPTLRNPVVLIIGLLVGFMLPRFWLGRRKSGRLKAFNKQLPDTITLIANALRAGSSFLQAIELVVRESRPPISTEFGRVIREVNLGLPFEHALENMVRRVKSDDFELMATAIAIQHQSAATSPRSSTPSRSPSASASASRARSAPSRRSSACRATSSASCRSSSPASCSSPRPGSCSRCSTTGRRSSGLPAGVIILLIGGFAMFIGFMFIRKIVDIEV